MFFKIPTSFDLWIPHHPEEPDNTTIEVPTKIWRGNGVMLEVGHGPNPNGFEPGAVANGFREYDLNWIAAKAAQEHLMAAGVPVTVQDNGGSLYRNGLLAKGYDVFVSIHHNAATVRAQGSEVLVHQDKSEEQDVALSRRMSAELALELGIRDRGVKTGRYAVLSGAEDVEYDDNFCASVLVECYFMTSALPSRMENWSERSGKAIARSIIDHLTELTNV